jgi:hypothetical protein
MARPQEGEGMKRGTVTPMDSPFRLYSFYKKHLLGMSREGQPHGLAAATAPCVFVKICDDTDELPTQGHLPHDECLIEVDVMGVLKSCVSDLSILRTAHSRAIEFDAFDLFVCNLLLHVQPNDEPSLEGGSSPIDVRRDDLKSIRHLDPSNCSNKRWRFFRDVCGARSMLPP